MSLIITLIIGTFFLDRISKILVTINMSVLNSYNIIPNFFNITYAKNFGAAFSFLKGGRYLFILIATVVVIFTLTYLKKNINKISTLDKMSLALILGGTIGNLLDRIIYGYVIDFLDFKIFNYNYPIFNLADTFIVMGAIMLMISSVRNDINAKNKSRRK